MMRIMLAMALLAAPLAAQPRDPDQATAKASDGGQVQVLDERPLADGDDPVNRTATAETVDALVMTLTLDGAAARLEQAVPARVSRGVLHKQPPAGDRVTVVAFARGREIGRANVPDQVINIHEGNGIVKATRRQISLAVPMRGAPDRLTVSAPATGVEASIDPAPLLADWCKADPRGRWCVASQR